MASAPTYTPIAATTLGSNTASVTFNSFSGYTDLIIVINGRTTRANVSDAVNVIFNSDNSNSYSFTLLYGDGSSASSGQAANTSSHTLGRLIGTSSTTQPSMLIGQIMNYSNTSTYKTILSRSANQITNNYGVYANVGLYRSTSAITSMTLTPAVGPNFVAGSTFTLYGILAA